MTQLPVNPFDYTKAVALSDLQIVSTWVDMPGVGGFGRILKPTSPMPMLLIGGKGSGRTHLLRYHSLPLLALRCKERPLVDAVREEGFLGVFLTCESLNSNRFAGKGVSEEAWADVFTYYMDLYLAQMVLQDARDLVAGVPGWGEVEGAFVREVYELFDQRDFPEPTSLTELSSRLGQLQREIDVIVNNAALHRTLEGLTIRTRRGRLVFGVPRALLNHLPAFDGVQFLYLLDEFENLGEAHQIYVNTLIREKQRPVSFKVSARLHGVRTYATYTEENRQDAEFERVALDEQMREDSRYPAFAERLIAKRLVDSGVLRLDEVETALKTTDLDSPAITELGKRLSGYFEEVPLGQFGRDATRFVEDKYAPERRPYLLILERKLLDALAKRQAEGLDSKADVRDVLTCIMIPDAPLLERANVFLLYRAWARRRNILAAAAEIRAAAAAYQAAPSEDSAYATTLAHFRGDLMAQLLRDCKQRQRYHGLATFIRMSTGNPRQLLTILRNVVQCATFNGEAVFGTRPISRQAQDEGVLQSSNWFFHDAQAVGPYAHLVQRGVVNLATLFRRLRFTDKPSECSLITFSAYLSDATPISRAVIAEAEQSSMIIRVVGGQKDKNSSAVVDKFYLNPMLSPRYHLPVARRGAIGLNADEVNALFDPEHEKRFEPVVKIREARMMAPFAFGDDPSDTGEPSPSGEQHQLFPELFE